MADVCCFKLGAIYSELFGHMDFLPNVCEQRALAGSQFTFSEILSGRLSVRRTRLSCSTRFLSMSSKARGSLSNRFTRIAGSASLKDPHACCYRPHLVRLASYGRHPRAHARLRLASPALAPFRSILTWLAFTVLAFCLPRSRSSCWQGYTCLGHLWYRGPK